MNVGQMSFCGSIIIIAVVLIRALGIERLPKRTFVLLWIMAALRLLVPFEIPSPLSIYNLAVSDGTVTGNASDQAVLVYKAIAEAGTTGQPVPAGGSAEVRGIPVLTVLWVAGIIICALYFAVRHMRSRSAFRFALPVESEFVRAFIQDQELRRQVYVKCSDMITSPLTYGVLRPVILLPRNIDWAEQKNLMLILAHELQHIKRFDVLKKLVLLAALCVHWFNPLVWIMYIYANRDIELACDEAVIRESGENYRVHYARILLEMEEWRFINFPLVSSFAENAVKERIKSIMKYKKIGGISIALAILITIVTVSVLGTSADDGMSGTEITPEETVETDKAYSSNVKFSYWNVGQKDIPRETDEEGNILDVEYILSLFGKYGVTYDSESDRIMYDGNVVTSLTLNAGTDQDTEYLFNYALDDEKLDESAGGVIPYPENYEDYVLTTDENGNWVLIPKWDFYGISDFAEPLPDESVEFMLSRYGEFGLTYSSESNCFMFDGEPVRSIEIKTGENLAEAHEFATKTGVDLVSEVDENYNIVGLVTYDNSYLWQEN